MHRFLVLLPAIAISACTTVKSGPDRPTELLDGRALAATPSQPFFADPPRWRSIYRGIDFAELANDKPRPLVVQILRIDTTAAGLELVTTPGNGQKPLETNGQTTRAFLEEHGLDVAINTHFFSPCCNLIPGEVKDLIGLSVAQGELVSPASRERQRDAIYFARGRQADGPTIEVIPMPATQLTTFYEEVDVTHAIAGRMVLESGIPIEGDGGSFSTDLHPRTLVGLGEDGTSLYLVTIDGRRPGYSTGASLAEAAAILHHVGASMALNVDGGGSTTMVIRDPDGASQLANSPSGGFERVVGSNLGFRARQLQPASQPTR
ncbi:MAG: phosphodiester glycosidase family protein [Phycisphaerales bacterium JB060]